MNGTLRVLLLYIFPESSGQMVQLVRRRFVHQKVAGSISHRRAYGEAPMQVCISLPPSLSLNISLDEGLLFFPLSQD